MTYKELTDTILAKLQSHPLIRTALFSSPLSWLNLNEQPEYPVGCFQVDTGNFSTGKIFNYSVQFWFLDKSGVDSEFETEVISEQHLVGNDIVSWLRRGDSDFLIDDVVTWTALSEKFEDYISGVEFTVNLNVNANYGACDYPVND